MRRIILACLLVPGLAAADIRLDLAPMPDLLPLLPVYPLDRASGGVSATIGVGYGTGGIVGESALLAGIRRRRLTIAGTSELAATDRSLLRGRHTGWLEIRTDDRGPDEELTAIATVSASLEHGEARGLAPVFLGPGKRAHAAGTSTVLIGLAPDKDDVVFGALVEADGSVTTWHDAPLLDRAYRGAFGLGFAIAPFDGELPRGRIDVLRARVEHANIQRTLRAAGVPMHDTQVRTIEVMTGLHDFTAWIDRDLLFAVTSELGAAWIESDATAGAIQDTLFQLNLGAHFKWRAGRKGRRELGFAWAREAGPTPDGQHHATDWRLEMVGATEDSKLALSARGGISWVTHHAGGTTDPDTMKRYGSAVEAFAKLGLGLEVGAYHAMTFEPRVAGDPWSAPRQLVTEAGVLVRWRPRSP